MPLFHAGHKVQRGDGKWQLHKRLLFFIGDCCVHIFS